MVSMLKTEFLEFLSDPGIVITHPRKSSLSLKDIFVFPDLLLSPRPPGDYSVREFKSEELLNVESLPKVISIFGPEDSGKTSLLKILLIHYIQSGLYPVFLDGKVTGAIGATGLWELIRASYEKQYGEEYLTQALTLSSENKLCLFDNFDRAFQQPDLAQNLLEEFRYLILTSETPLVRALNQLDEGSAIITELSEFGPLHRRELCRKWHELGTQNESSFSTREIDLKIESSFKLMGEALSRGLVPSYPVIFLSLLHSTDSSDDYLLSGGTYTHYLEHIITKPLREGPGREEYEKLVNHLSNIARKMFTEDRSAVSAPEIRELLGEGSENIISELIRAKIITEKGAGYEFKYGYNYFYFTACYLKNNLSSVSVRESISELCRSLQESGSVNIMLFLIHLADDPFIAEEINRALETSLSEVSEDSLDNRVRELDEVIESILSSEQKDKKLREIRAEYEAPGKRPWATEPLRRGLFEHTGISTSEKLIERIHKTRKELGLLRISGALLKIRLSESPHSSRTKSLARAYYLMWLRSLSSAVTDLVIRADEAPSDRTTYESGKSDIYGNEEYLLNIERFSDALSLFMVYIKELSQTLGEISLSQIFSGEGDVIPAGSLAYIDICTRRIDGESALNLTDIQRLISTQVTGPFILKVIRESIYSQYQKFYYGEELKEKISELDKILNPLDQPLS